MGCTGLRGAGEIEETTGKENPEVETYTLCEYSNKAIMHYHHILLYKHIVETSVGNMHENVITCMQVIKHNIVTDVGMVVPKIMETRCSSACTFF